MIGVGEESEQETDEGYTGAMVTTEPNKTSKDVCVCVCVFDDNKYISTFYNSRFDSIPNLTIQLEHWVWLTHFSMQSNQSQ